MACSPVRRRHRDVEDREVDVACSRPLDRLRPILGLGDDLDVGLGVEHGAQAAAHNGVVVSQQNPWSSAA